MKYWLYSILLIITLSCCNNKLSDKEKLPSEIANKRWYKAELVGGEYKVPDNYDYYAITTRENEIELCTEKNSDPIIFKVIRIDTLKDDDVMDYKIHLEPQNSLASSLSYKVRCIDNEKGIYYWLYCYNELEWVDNQYFSIYAALDQKVDSESSFKNKLPEEFRLKEFYRADFIHPNYYVYTDATILYIRPSAVEYYKKSHGLDYVDSTEYGVKLVVSYATRNEITIRREDEKGVYWGNFNYKESGYSFTRSHYLVESSLIDLNDEERSERYETNIPRVKILSPIYTMPAITVTRQYEKDRIRLRHAKQIQNIDSYIRYKYNDWTEVTRRDIHIFREYEKDDVAVIIKENDDYDPKYKFLYFNRVQEAEDSYIVLSEIELNISDVEDIEEFLIGNSDGTLSLEAIVGNNSKIYYWEISPNDDIWSYQSKENIGFEVEKGKSLEDIDHLSFD